MTADQLIERAGSPPEVVPGAGRLRYVVSPDHRHRHLLGFDRYALSVGYGDDYPANLEGQYLRLTGLSAGRYVLVHRVNGARRLRELDHGNNAASLLLQLRWRADEPMVRILKRCPDSSRCDR